MTTTLITFVAIGFLSYWLLKLGSELKAKGTSINSAKDFFASNWIEIIISSFGVLIIAFGGDSLSESIGNITNPLTAFIAGGAVPSMVKNIVGNFVSK